MTDERESQYQYFDPESGHTSRYLWKAVTGALANHGARRVLDLGYGNGAFTAHLVRLGFDATGCDPSETGIEIARTAHPKIPFHLLGEYDDPRGAGLGTFDAVVALEVIEHLYFPRRLLEFALKSLESAGLLVVTTPYHGYLKNMAISLTGSWDAHWAPGWEGGHIKFWSRASLWALMREAGFTSLEFRGAGRAPLLWKSMIVCGKVG